MDNLRKRFTVDGSDWRLLMRPAGLKLLLREARLWLVLTALAALLVRFAYPPATAWLFRLLYPPPEKNFFQRIFDDSSAVPAWVKAQAQVGSVLYVLCALGALIALWAALQPAAREAIRLANEHISKGMLALQSGQIRQAQLEYRSALGLQLDPLDRRETEERLRRTFLAPSVVAQAAAVPAAPFDATVALSPDSPGSPASYAATEHTVAISPSSASNRRVGLHGRYELRRLLGKGGMGEVHEAFDRTLERTVALKLLPNHLASDSQFLTRFTQEAKALARVAHPNVVQIFDIFDFEGQSWLSLEYVAGGDLQSLVDKEGPLAPVRALSIAAAIADGLAFAHAQGIVHRDVKPLNVLMTADGRPKLTDFGLARIEAATQLTVAGAILGSPHYMSPEQAEGKTADARSDVYSLGISLYFMLTGDTPFHGEVQQVLLQHLTQNVPAIPAVSAPINALIARCTARNADERFVDGAALAAELRLVAA